jgi:cbb3-type cytochrome oxidase cytochrome c subunit
MMSGKGRGRMDLSHIGGQGKTSDWIAAHIKNPKAHNPGSKMPAFEGKLVEADIKSLADHLASLK